MDRIMKLSIISPLYYIPTDKSIDQLLSSLPNEKIGFDAIAEYSFTFDDESLELLHIRNGLHTLPHTLEEEQDPNPALSFKLEAGSYLFLQTIPSLNEAELRRAILPFLKDKKEGRLFVRLFKENTFEYVMQFFTHFGRTS